MKEYDFYISENEAIRSYFEKKYGKQYSKDGVLSPKKMFSNPNRLRVVYLLKENYNEVWNPCDNLENEYVHYPSKSNGSSKWGENMYKPIKFLTEPMSDETWFESVPKDMPEEYSVTGFAYINVKKKAEGKTQSDDKDIDAYARDDASELKRQIISCHPDIVLCAGGGWQAKRFGDIIFEGEKREEIIKERAWLFDYTYQGKKNSLVAVSCVHPSFWGANSLRELKDNLETLKPILEKIRRENMESLSARKI